MIIFPRSFLPSLFSSFLLLFLSPHLSFSPCLFFSLFLFLRYFSFFSCLVTSLSFLTSFLSSQFFSLVSSSQFFSLVSSSLSVLLSHFCYFSLCFLKFFSQVSSLFSLVSSIKFFLPRKEHTHTQLAKCVRNHKFLPTKNSYPHLHSYPQKF